MSLLLRAASFAVLLSCALPTVCQATPQLLAPIGQGSTDVPYPTGALGDASITLELTVEKDGTVSDATVLEGTEPFAEQARRAVLSWRFAPALRGDTPVRARIRARVDFHADDTAASSPPVSSVPQQAAPATTSAPSEAAVAATPEAPVEITVLGIRHESGQTTLSASDVREMPGAFGDGFRAIEALPGVAPMLSGLPYF